MPDRQQTLQAVKVNVRNENLVKHMLAAEAIMRALARRLDQDQEEWGLAGLVHDIDVEITQGQPERHSQVGEGMAREVGASEAICRAVLRHNEIHGLACETSMEKALFCADPLTGLITAAALVRPDKSLAGLTVDSLLKRFGEKRFAAGASREGIASCRELGLTLEEFLALGLEAMKGISADLGL